MNLRDGIFTTSMSGPETFTQGRTDHDEHTSRLTTLVAVVAISAACGRGQDAVDEIEPGDTEAAMQEADDTEPAEDDGVGEFAITMSGDMTGELTGTEVQCAQFRETRTITLRGDHDGESVDVALSDETFDDGTVGKVIFGSYLRSAGEGGTLTIDESGATFDDLEVGAVTITGSVTC